MTITEEVRFASKYLLGDRIGRGAMGNVFEAKVDDGSVDRVAIKILKSELVSEEKTVARFIQEGEIFRLIDHENVIKVIEVVAEDEQLAIVMELVPDGDLRQIMKRGIVTPSLALKIAADVAAGLEATHEANVVHRDLKPPNILMADTEDGWVAKISDFGISRLLDDATTRSSTTIGTPLYMAPEAFAKGGPEAPADIYALGIIIFELLVGHAPFHVGGTLGVIRSHADDLPPTLHGVPEELSLLVGEMLEKDPEVRPNAEELTSRLLAILPLMDNDEVPYDLPALEPLLVPGEAEAEEDESEDRVGLLIRPSNAAAKGKLLLGAERIAARVGTVADRLPFSNFNLIAGAVFTTLLLAVAGFSIFSIGSKETTVASSEIVAPNPTSPVGAFNQGAGQPNAPEAGSDTDGSEDSGLPSFGQGQAPGSVRRAGPDSDEDVSNTTRAPVTAAPRITRRQVEPAPVVEQPATTRVSATTSKSDSTVSEVTAATVATTEQETTTPATTTRSSTTARDVTTTVERTTTAPTTVQPTTAAPTTAAPTTETPASARIVILSGPSIVSKSGTSVNFAYTTNAVCGSGSFSYTNTATGVSAGSHTGDDSCFGPYHEGRSAWGAIQLEPGTTYTVRLTVHGKPSNGSLATGTGSSSSTFQVTTSS